MSLPGSSAWLVFALLSAGFAALTAIFAKIGVAEVNSNLATLIRTVIIAAILGVFLAATDGLRALSSIPARSWLFLSFSALATGASWACYFRALQLGDAARVAPIDKLSVVLVAIFAVIFLGERLSAANWLGVGLIACGALLIAFGK
ncbi:EamA family transporter [Methylocella silvestris]|uniref:Transporter n=1 Tax=Methylocella silvestris TaxID=199596 RepID=A0A2J7TCU8_METSI|nr:EamA family transporter [Methylocella silvestris]PNG24588.1 transporter [Methylocella silvestris]